MITKNVIVSEKSESLDLGFRLENGVRAIVFDITYFIENFGAGDAQLLVKRSADSQPYPVALISGETEVGWVITNADTAYKGAGECELFWFIGEELAKSVKYPTWVADDIGESTTPPQPYEGWITQLIGTMDDKLGEAQSYVEDAEAWAKGTRDGEAVDPQDGTYHNNAKYWSEQSESAAQQAITTLAQTIYIDDNGLFQIHG